jgi:methyl-accepting chemotaxis protein/methyl-accepting chemotaxis protein-1 (serine sensor receptor)
MMKKATIGVKLGAAFGCLLAVTVVLGAALVRMTGDLTSELERAVNVVARTQLLAGHTATATAKMAVYERSIALALVLQQGEKAAGYRRDYEAAEVEMAGRVRDLADVVADEQGRHIVRTLSEKIEAQRRNHRDFLALLAGQQIDAALKLFDERVAPSLQDMSASAKQLVDLEEQRLGSVAGAAESRRASTWWLLISLFVVAVPLGAGVLIVIRDVSGTLRQFSGRIAGAARQVADASRQILQASRCVADGASSQAGSLEETSASSHELSSLTQKNAEQSRSAATMMSDAEERVREANRTVDEMVASMRDISSSSEKIAKIIKVIDEISFQTNILALNAAVEAARAGEAGMGFAVVADEVRRLAQRCAQAAKDTAELIEESIGTSSEGSRKIERMAQSIGSITASASQVKQIVDELNHSSQEQAQGIELISSALTQLESVTQQAAASAEQSASLGEAMSSQAEVMQSVVTELVALVGESDK